MRNLQHQVGARVRQLREKKGVSQEALAAICNLHRTYVGLIERGERSLSLATIEQLAQGLEVPVSELFSGFDAIPQGRTRKVKPRVPAEVPSVPAQLAAIRQILIDAKLTDSRRYDALVAQKKGKVD